MGLFVYTQKGSIISTVDLPTTEIIEPKIKSFHQNFPQRFLTIRNAVSLAVCLSVFLVLI